MDKQLTQRILDVIVELWKAGIRPVPSKTVYDRLLNAGVEVPNGEMIESLKYLNDTNFIEGRGYNMNSENLKTHGAMEIICVSDGLLD